MIDNYQGKWVPAAQRAQKHRLNELSALQYGKRLREMEGWDEIKSEHPTLMNEIVEYMLGLVEIA